MYFYFPVITLHYPRCDGYLLELIEQHRVANDAHMQVIRANHRVKQMMNQNVFKKQMFKTPRPSRKNTYVGNKSPR